jgi:localization factor PodJL
MTQAARPAPAVKPEDTPGFQVLEKAVRNIVEHMEVSEKRNRDTLKSLQDRIANMSTKAQAADSEHLVKQAPAFTQLESRLSELARRVERHEQAPQSPNLPDLLRREMTDLVKRIDDVRDNSEALAMRAQTQAVQASQQELRAIEGRILGLLKETQNSLGSGATAPAEVQRLRDEIDRLHQRIDDAQGSVASGQDVVALRTAVEQLSTRVAQGPDLRPLADMDRRLLDITQKLEQTQAATRGLPQFTDLESRVAELDYRFNEAIAGRASSHSQEIEQRLADVAERLGRTEQQLTSLETIERAVNQLFDTVEQQRSWTEQVAENAATRMADRLAAQVPQQQALAASPEIQALEQGLRAVRAASESADHRNQETLEAVHDTLEQIVDKLAELETAAIGQRIAAVAAPVAAPVAVDPVAELFEEQPVAEAPTHNPFAPHEPEAAPIAQDLPPVQTSGNPFTDAFNSAQVQTGDTLNEGVDFIAAARRAQANTQEKSILGSMAPGARKTSDDKGKKSLGLSFFKRKPKESILAPGLTGEIKHPPGFQPANANTDNKRRKLLLMGLVLLAAVSAFTFNMVGRTNKAKAPVQPTAIEQSIEKPATGAAPAAAAPKAAPIETGLLEPELGSDPVLTGSLPQTMGTTSVSSLVAGEAAQADDMPSAEVGNLALREAAALGDASAQFVVATRYLNGENVQQDYAKAAYWYGKAAAQGSAPAQYRVATMYERGRGVARDLKAALGWYERAASAGNIKSMHNAAVLASGNELGQPDYQRAYKWFSLGAAHGLKDSQFNLAVLIERGLGTATSPADAYFWYAAAAKQDDAMAAKRATALAEKLTEAELAAAKAKLASWRVEKAPDAANVVAVNNTAWTAGG